MPDPRYNTIQLLEQNKSIVLAYVRPANAGPELHIHLTQKPRNDEIAIPESLATLKLIYHVGPILNPLICDSTYRWRATPNQQCQDEPIQLGCQLQPQGQAWVGTAGCPIKWIDAQQKPHWGILSNWHVMAQGIERAGHTQHQPDDRHSAVAALTAWSAVYPTGTNRVDAAIADALIQGKHTISDKILAIGQTSNRPLNATAGLQVSKSGRTSGLTHARCSAVGASARVNYGEFDALFDDQDVYEDVDAPFSAPGDSGSLILGRSCLCPTSLLFAGGGTTTIGNPIRHVINKLNLVYPFP